LKVDLLQRALPTYSDGYCKHNQANEEHSMMDLLMLALAFGFFALAIGYTYACERL
jgi:vacuolar-type H+-ATPase subunit I/STV1